MSFSEANIKKYASENTSSGLRRVDAVWSLRRSDGRASNVLRRQEACGGLMGGTATSTALFACFVGHSFMIKLMTFILKNKIL